MRRHLEELNFLGSYITAVSLPWLFRFFKYLLSLESTCEKLYPNLGQLIYVAVSPDLGTSLTRLHNTWQSPRSKSKHPAETEDPGRGYGRHPSRGGSRRWSLQLRSAKCHRQVRCTRAKVDQAWSIFNCPIRNWDFWNSGEIKHIWAQGAQIWQKPLSLTSVSKFKGRDFEMLMKQFAEANIYLQQKLWRSLVG